MNRIAVSLLVLLTCASARAEGYWNWSPPAAHHAAVVQVLHNGSQGSGYYVELPAADADSKPCRGVLTAGHVVGRGDGMRVKWADGTETTGWACGDKTGADLAWIITEHAKIQPYRVSTRPVQVGEKLEFCGFGGPKDVLRHWYGTIKGQIREGYVAYDCAVLQGDSGGPILRGDELVGVICTGSGQLGQLGAAIAFRQTQGPDNAVVQSFAQRLAVRFGKPEAEQPPSDGGCPGGTCPESGGCPGGVCPDNGGCPGGSCPPRRRAPTPPRKLTPGNAYPPASPIPPQTTPYKPILPSPTPPAQYGPEFAPPVPGQEPVPAPGLKVPGVLKNAWESKGEFLRPVLAVVIVGVLLIGLTLLLLLGKRWFLATIKQEVASCVRSSPSPAPLAPVLPSAPSAETTTP